MNTAASTEWQWQWTSSWPTSLVILIAALLTIFLAWTHLGWNRYGIPRGASESSTHRSEDGALRWYSFLLHWTAVMGMLAWLFSLGWMGYERKPARLVILMDDSRSMLRADELSDDLTQDSESGTRHLPVTRFDRACQWLRMVSDYLQESTPSQQTDVQWLSQRDHTLPLSAAIDNAIGQRANGIDSPIGDAIVAFANIPLAERPQAMVVVSDGQANHGLSLSDAAVTAAASGIQVHTVALGGRISWQEVHVRSVDVDDQALLGEQIVAMVEVDFLGQTPASFTVSADLHSDTPDKQSRRLAEVHVRGGSEGAANHVAKRGMPHQESHTVPLVIPASEPGPMQIEFGVRLDENPASIANTLPDKSSTIRRSILVIDRPVNVILMASVPSYEFRALRELFSRAADASAQQAGRAGTPAWRFQAVLYSADPRIDQIDRWTRARPSGNWLPDADVIILDDVSPTNFSNEEQLELVRWVEEHGGGLVWISGPTSSSIEFDGPLVRLLPYTPLYVHDRSISSADDGPFRMIPTRLGHSFPPMRLSAADLEMSDWWRLPVLYRHLAIQSVHPGVRTLARRHDAKDSVSDAVASREGEADPLATLHFLGAGRILWHAMDETWRWRIGRSDRDFAHYWQQVIRYLAKERIRGAPGITLRTSKELFSSVDPVPVEAIVGGESRALLDEGRLNAAVLGSDGTTRLITLQQDAIRRHAWLGTVPPLLPGSYRLELLNQPMTVTWHFRVQETDHELQAAWPDHDPLRELASRTGGRFAFVYDSQELLHALESLPSPAPTTVAFRRLLPSWLFLFIVCGSLAADWLGTARTTRGRTNLTISRLN